MTGFPLLFQIILIPILKDKSTIQCIYFREKYRELYKLESRKERQKPRRPSTHRRRISSTDLRRSSSDSGGATKQKPELTANPAPVIKVNGVVEEDIRDENGSHDEISQNGRIHEDILNGCRDKESATNADIQNEHIVEEIQNGRLDQDNQNGRHEDDQNDLKDHYSEYHHKKYERGYHDSDSEARLPESLMAKPVDSKPPILSGQGCNSLEDIKFEPAPVASNFHETFAKFKRSYLSTKYPDKPRPSATVTSASSGGGRPNPLENWSKLLEQSTIKTEPVPCEETVFVKQEPQEAGWEDKQDPWDQKDFSWQPLPPAQYKPEVSKVFKRKGSREEEGLPSPHRQSPKKRPKLEKFIVAKTSENDHQYYEEREAEPRWAEEREAERQTAEAERRRAKEQCRKDHKNCKKHREHHGKKHRSKEREQGHTSSKEKHKQKHSKEHRDSKEYKEHRDSKEYKVYKESKEHREMKKEHRDCKDFKETKAYKEKKEHREKKEHKEKKSRETYHIVQPEYDLTKVKEEYVDEEEEEQTERRALDDDRRAHKKDKRREKEKKKKRRKEKKLKRVKVRNQ